VAGAAAVKTPFPWFGSKSPAARLIWSRLGDIKNYIEPFAGSLAVLLARPHWPFRSGRRIEIVNDLDGFLSNFWRAVKSDPDGVAFYADHPISECDLVARRQWLHEQVDVDDRLKSDPEWFDPKIAGYWCWLVCATIADSFRGHGTSALPHLASGVGVLREDLPAPPGWSPVVRGGVEDRRRRIVGFARQLADRLRGVRVCCGDWTRVLSPCATVVLGETGVLLDPPYDVDGAGYGCDSAGVSAAVREWAIANGDDPRLRIALCGYVDEGHTDVMPPDWGCIKWRPRGGYNNIGCRAARPGSSANRERKRIWFSPHCLRPGLFDFNEELA